MILDPKQELIFKATNGKKTIKFRVPWINSYTEDVDAFGGWSSIPLARIHVSTHHILYDDDQEIGEIYINEDKTMYVFIDGERYELSITTRDYVEPKEENTKDWLKLLE